MAHQVFLRLKQIIGDPKAEPPIQPIFPVSRSTWWRGIQQGIYPKPTRISHRCIAWRVDEIEALLSKGGVE